MNKENKLPLRLPSAARMLPIGVASFLLAYRFQECSFLIGLYLYSLVVLARVATVRQAFYLGLVVGMLTFPFELTCFYHIFGPGAAALWLVLSFWIGLFVALAHLCFQRLKPLHAALLVPFLWTGLEYFRSELYYLRFSWLNIGFAFSPNLHWPPVKQLGVYGIGFVLALLAGLLVLQPWRRRVIAGTLLLAGLGVLANLPRSGAPPNGNLSVAGLQTEFPIEGEIPHMLDKLLKQHPDPQLIVLSEYTYDGPPPEELKAWCRRNGRHVIVGGREPTGDKDFHNTAFVIDPNGEVVFRQAKSVPIQFFKDGKPAPEQKLWDSPWGKIGICICYDLSYSRVADRLIRLGAQALIVPTMDVADWGRREHELHTYIAPMRAAEYGVPIFRLASSGISQCVDASGNVTATAPFPGEEEMLAGTLAMDRTGTLPLDRMLAPFSTAVAAVVMVGIVATNFRRKPKVLVEPGLKMS